MCVCVGREDRRLRRQMEKNRKLRRRSGGEFRYKNIRKLKDKEVVRDQQEEGRARDER